MNLGKSLEAETESCLNCPLKQSWWSGLGPEN